MHDPYIDNCSDGSWNDNTTTIRSSHVYDLFVVSCHSLLSRHVSLFCLTTLFLTGTRSNLLHGSIPKSLLHWKLDSRLTVLPPSVLVEPSLRKVWIPCWSQVWDPIVLDPPRLLVFFPYVLPLVFVSSVVLINPGLECLKPLVPAFCGSK